MDGDPRNIARNVGYALVVLVPDEAFGDDVEGLRNIDQRCVGLSRNRRAVGIDPDRARARVLRVNGCRWLRLWARRRGARRGASTETVGSTVVAAPRTGVVSGAVAACGGAVGVSCAVAGCSAPVGVWAISLVAPLRHIRAAKLIALLPNT